MSPLLIYHPVQNGALCVHTDNKHRITRLCFYVICPVIRVCFSQCQQTVGWFWACFKRLHSYINFIQTLNTSACWPCIHHSRYRYFLIQWIKIFTWRQPASVLWSKEYSGFQRSTVTLSKQRLRTELQSSLYTSKGSLSIGVTTPNARSCLSRNAYPRA